MALQRGIRPLIGSMIVAMCLASPAVACEMAGANTHVGEIKAIDPGRPSLTILDRQTKKTLTFVAGKEQIRGLSAGQQVAVTYSESKGQLRAEEVQAR